MSEEAVARAERLATIEFSSVVPRGGFVRGTWTSVKDILSHRELLMMLVRRELKARYKDSVLGFFWALMRPLTQLLIYYVAIGKFMGADKGIPDYAVFVYGGLTLWTLFSDIIAMGTGSIVGNAGLVKKIYLPRELFPLSAIGSALFNFCIQMIFVFVATLLVRKPPTGIRLLYFPLSVLLIMLLATALALVLSAVNVYLRDVQYLVEVAVMVLFWASPIVYSYQYVVNAPLPPWVADVYLMNPITIAVMGFQKAFWVAGDSPVPGAQPTINPATGQSVAPLPAGAYPDDLAMRLILMCLVAAVLLWVCQRIFSRLQANFAQEL